MKTVLFIPGGKQYYHTHDYPKTLRAIRKKGYKAVFVHMNWRRSTLPTQVDQLNEIYKKYDPKKTILAGFSWGAMTALVAATAREPKELWLFSLSDHFKEIVEKTPDKISKTRLEVFRRTPLVPLAKKINCKTLMWLGEAEAKEFPTMGMTAKLAHKYIKKSKLVMVPNAPHDVTNTNYVQSIFENI
jgi:pimeloyl-ACP methyl ester carboxylesterase